MTFDKDYFNGEGSNNRPYKDMMIMKKVYLPKVNDSINLNAGIRILDIGCAFGYFLKCCDEYNCETYGIDVSEYAISQAEKETKAKLYVYDINNNLSIFQDNFFDIVTIFDVIEHIESPYKLLKEVYRVLKTDGNIIVTTPNLNAIDRLIRGVRWHGFQDKSHIYLFTPTSFIYLVNLVGFKTIKSSTPFHPLPKIVQKIADKTGLGGQIWLVAKKI